MHTACLLTINRGDMMGCASLQIKGHPSVEGQKVDDEVIDERLERAKRFLWEAVSYTHLTLPTKA